MIKRAHALTGLLAASAILLGVMPAVAADGEILINQAKVNAGGITPGDTAGFPALLSRSGRYKLTGNLRVPAGENGIEIRANDIILDLNGFSISSEPAGAASGGVFIREGDRVRIANGTI